MENLYVLPRSSSSISFVLSHWPLDTPNTLPQSTVSIKNADSSHLGHFSNWPSADAFDLSHFMLHYLRKLNYFHRVNKYVKLLVLKLWVKKVHFSVMYKEEHIHVCQTINGIWCIKTKGWNWSQPLATKRIRVGRHSRQRIPSTLLREGWR